MDDDTGCADDGRLTHALDAFDAGASLLELPMMDPSDSRRLAVDASDVAPPPAPVGPFAHRPPSRWSSISFHHLP